MHSMRKGCPTITCLGSTRSDTTSLTFNSVRVGPIIAVELSEWPWNMEDVVALIGARAEPMKKWGSYKVGQPEVA